MIRKECKYRKGDKIKKTKTVIIMEKFKILMLGVLAVGLISCNNDAEIAEVDSAEDTISVETVEPEEPAREETEEPEQTRPEITYAENGRFSLQVESWRSEQRAEQRASVWRERGFEHAYVVQHKSDEDGDIWYRVNIGNFSNQDMAELVRVKLAREHEAESWITTRD